MKEQCKLTSGKRIAVQTIALMRFLSFEDRTPLVDTEVGVWCRFCNISDSGRQNERANGLVELVDAVVREGRGVVRCGYVGTARDLVLDNEQARVRFHHLIRLKERVRRTMK